MNLFKILFRPTKHEVQPLPISNTVQTLHDLSDGHSITSVIRLLMTATSELRHEDITELCLELNETIMKCHHKHTMKRKIHQFFAPLKREEDKSDKLSSYRRTEQVEFDNRT